MTKLVDAWSNDDFEEVVAAALITCFETRIRKNRGAGPNALNEERVKIIRASGPYVPGNDRVIVVDTEQTQQFFDLKNDPLPTAGCLAYSALGQPIQDHQYSGWFRSMYTRQVTELPRYWHRRAGGQLYELFYLSSENEYVEGERFFFSVTKEGKVVACEQIVSGDTGAMSGRHETFKSFPHELETFEICATTTLQYLADKRFCWTIEAHESTAFVRIGCQEEEVKSLLYARTLPQTATGRKRPILHLVEAHKRRMRNGVEIDIAAGARGVETVEIGGTRFTVRPPAVVIPTLSLSSQRRLSLPL